MRTVSRQAGKILRATLFSGLLLGLSACGQGIDPLTGLSSVDPLSVGQSSLAFPLLPVGSSFFTVQFNSGNEWILVGGYIGTQAKAAAAGVVVSVDTTQVTILHNSRLSTRIGGITPSGITLGSYVVQGQVVGVVASLTSSGVPFAVLVDNVTVCPLSFMTSTARQQIITGATIATLCPS